MMKADLKIAVYAIAKNEEPFVQRWAEQVQLADYIIIGDTGSDDGTAYQLHDNLGFRITYLHVLPWRFDDARNAVLHQIPDWIDVCLSLDLDEVLPDDWREQIESVWTSETNMGWYDFVWSHDEEGTSDVQFKQHKLHSRHGWRWKSPVHEDLVWYGEGEPVKVDVPMTIHHWPDSSKSRSSYLPLLKMAVQESPEDVRMRHYLGRELMYNEQFQEAIDELYLCAITTTWVNERAVSFIYISDCYLQIGELEWAETYAFTAQKTMPEMRETWGQLVKVFDAKKQFEIAVLFARQGMKCLVQHPTYINSNWAWSGYLENIIKKHEI